MKNVQTERTIINLSKAYYKDYFSDTTFCLSKSPHPEITANNDKVQEKNKALLETANRSYCEEAQKVYSSNHLPITHSFRLEVCYPGLVTGIGINHEAKIEGEFKLGIHLDYTTGLPVIYGSSVKGVLRSAFQEEDLLEVLPILVPEIKNDLETIQRQLQNKSLKEWANSIFGDDDDRDARSVYERDIFFDAIIDSTNKQGHMLASDSITPHGNDPLKNPTPLTFVRIASGCQIRFRFCLTDSATLTADKKAILFKAILKAFGIGAKTNVGYGRLKEK